MTCDVCGQSRFRDDRVSETFRLGDSIVVVEGIPAQVCENCSEATIAAEVAARVRELVHTPHEPARVVHAEILRYRAG